MGKWLTSWVRGAILGPMTVQRELSVNFTDGSWRIIGHEPDDAAGRKAIEREAFAWIARPTVKSVEVKPVSRHASTSGRGRYR